MNKRKRTIEQIIIYQTLHRKINIDQHVLYDYYYYYYYYRELDYV
jgi:ssDNA-specific exonuclease RecJ